MIKYAELEDIEGKLLIKRFIDKYEFDKLIKSGGIVGTVERDETRLCFALSK